MRSTVDKMIDWDVAFSGWGTAIAFTVIGTGAVRLWIRRRETSTIRRLARIDVIAHIRFLSFALDKRLHPDREFRYPVYLSRDLFSMWAPNAIRRWPAVAGDIARLHDWATHADIEMRDHGRSESVWVEGHIDVVMMGVRISDKLGLDLGDFEALNSTTSADYYRA